MVQRASLQMRSIMPLTDSAFSAKVALACEVARLISELGQARVSLFLSRVSELAWDAGRKAAMEGDDLASPLVDLAVAGCAGVRRVFELAYWSHATSTNPSTFFELASEGQWVRIASKGVAGAGGQVRLHSSHVRQFFARAEDLNLTSYYSWAVDPCPAGGLMVLYRNHRLAPDGVFDYDERDCLDAEPKPGPKEGMLVINPDTHPSSGSICFGDPSQELVQLGALIRLKAQVRTLLSDSSPSPQDRAAVAARAAQIARRVRQCFMDSSGYCSWCRSDVTLALASRGQDDAITGCPCCGHTWCD